MRSTRSSATCRRRARTSPLPAGWPGADCPLSPHERRSSLPRSSHDSGAEDPALLRRELLFAQHALGLQLAELPELGQLGVHVVSGRGGVIGLRWLVSLCLIGLLLLLGGPP